MKEPIQLKTLRRLTLLLAIPMLVGLVMWAVAREAGRRADWVKHTLLVELSLERLVSGLRDAETSSRGYLLTGESEFLVPYDAACAAVRREIVILAKLTADNPRQQSAVRQLLPLVDSRIAQTVQNLDRYRAGALGSPAGKAGLDRGQSLMDSIRSLTDEMRRDEESLLRIREKALSVATQRLFWSLGLGYGLIVLVVGSLYRNLGHYARRSRDATELLSLQNAELETRVRDRTASLERRDALMNMFIRHVPAAVAMLDREMNYLQVSDRWCADYSLDKSHALGRSHYEAFPDLPERWKQIHRRCRAGETLCAEEDRWDRPEGHPLWLHWEVRPWGSRNGLPEGILIFTEDVTARKRTSEMLLESEATMHALLETAAQGILAVNTEGTIVIANRMAGEMFGYGPRELLGKHLDLLLPEKLRARHQAHRAGFASSLRTRPMGIGLDLQGLRKDGSQFPIEVSLSSVDTSRGPLAVSFVSDITARKNTETALQNSEQQLRALAGNLLTAQEDERRRVARELHDDVTQRLAFLAMELGKVAGEMEEPVAEKRSQVRTLQGHALQLCSELRRLSHGLHPSVIEDFGLSIALEGFCEEFGKSQGVEVRFEGFVEDSHLDAAGATCLFRIAQESLRNAVTHGRATEVTVTVNAEPDSMQLKVRDNGVGFAVDGASAKPGLGVVSMRERIRLVNGTLTLSSQVGQGTEITASVPLIR